MSPDGLDMVCAPEVMWMVPSRFKQGEFGTEWTYFPNTSAPSSVPRDDYRTMTCYGLANLNKIFFFSCVIVMLVQVAYLFCRMCKRSELHRLIQNTWSVDFSCEEAIKSKLLLRGTRVKKYIN